MKKFSKFIKAKLLPILLGLFLMLSNFNIGVSAINLEADTIEGAGFPSDFLTSEQNLVYGNPSAANVTPQTMQAGTHTMLLGSIDAEGNETSKISSFILKGLTDGVLSNCDGRPVNHYFRDENGNVRNDIFYDVIFKLDSKYSHLKMLVIDTANASMRVTDYSVYASGDADALFEGDPIVAHRANAKQYNTIEINKNDIQYVALRIYSACTPAFTNAYTSCYVRLMDVAICGSPAFQRTESNSLAGVGLTESALQNNANAFYGFEYKSNVIAENLTAKSFSYAKGEIDVTTGAETSTVRTFKDATDDRASRLVNGITDTGSGKNADCYVTTFYKDGVKNTTGFTEISFNLGSVHTLDNLLITDAASASSTPATNQYATDYSIFISNTASELYKNPPIVSHAGNTTRFNLFQLSGKEAQYIGIRVYSACTAELSQAGTQAILRFSEIALFAEPKGITAEAKLEGAAESEETYAKVDKEKPLVGETVTFTTYNTNEDYEFKGWKDASGEFISYENFFQITAAEDALLLSYAAVYELKENILIKEDFEGSTTVSGLTGLSLGTAGSFNIETRKGSSKGVVLKYDKTTTDWGYAKFIKDGANLFKGYALEKERSAL